MKVYYLTVFALLSLMSCNNPKSDVEINSNPNLTDIDSSKFAGQYLEIDTTYQVNQRTFVSEDYAKRNEGYDWIAVDIDSIGVDTITVKVFSRSDIKKPTCNFYAKAFELEKGIYRSINTDPIVMITLDGEDLHLGSVSEEENQKLMFYCSGGGNLVGDYQLLKETIDSSQLDSIK